VRHLLTIADLPRDDAAFLAGLLVKYPLVQDAAYLERQRLAYGLPPVGSPDLLRQTADASARTNSVLEGFSDALERASPPDVRLVEWLDQRREGRQLRELLFKLVHLSGLQVSLPGTLRKYASSKDERDWRQAASTVAGLAHNVRELMGLLKALDGDFGVYLLDDYRDLIFGLTARTAAYDELASMNAPTSDADIAQLLRIADQYEQLMQGAARAQRAIAAYLRAL
jgi:hypothetical protein